MDVAHKKEIYTDKKMLLAIKFSTSWLCLKLPRFAFGFVRCHHHDRSDPRRKEME